MAERLERISTGIDGLDEVLDGGLVANRTYMVRGEPGAGKSIMGLHLLSHGAQQGESVLYVNLEEPEGEIRENARSLGIDLDGVDFLDLSPDSEFFAEDLSYDIFSPDEVEENTFTSRISDRVQELEPSRIFVDPITQLRYLSPDEYQFRKEVLSFMRYLKEAGATVLFTSQDSPNAPDDDLQFMSDGIVQLDRSNGGGGRTVSVPKFRGSSARDGDHAMRIRSDGMHVYPVLRPERHGTDFEPESISSGVPELDRLLDGGVERGTVTIVSGSPGVGKTTTGLQFMKEAAGRGERSVVYSFEEGRDTLMHRCESVNIPVRRMVDRGTLRIEEVEALRQSATEFAHNCRREVEENDTRIVMIDGVEGFKQALTDADDALTSELHSLCRYLKNMGVTVILMNEIRTIVGDFQLTQEGLSYLSDSIVFIQHIEMDGEMRKVIGVLKKRTSDFERHVREFKITPYGVKIGEPLVGLTGILSGDPTWRSDPGDAPGDRWMSEGSATRDRSGGDAPSSDGRRRDGSRDEYARPDDVVRDSDGRETVREDDPTRR